MTATIGTLPRNQALGFLGLFVIPAMGQAILLAVVPLVALRLLGSARAVTVLYVCVGVLTVFGRFSIPLLTRLLRRRYVFTLGGCVQMLASLLFSLDSVPALACGLVLSSFAIACIEVTCQLYLLDNVPRTALRHFEPIRIFASAGPWTLGPWLGVYLQSHVAPAAPFGVTAMAAVAGLCLFWALRPAEQVAVVGARLPPINPVRFLPRFFAQPRLLLAWTLASARSSWWAMFYVYVPIFAVTSGLGAETGGMVASIGTAWVCMVPLWGWAGRRFGLRVLLLTGYAIAGGFSIGAAFSFGVPWLGAVLLVMAAMGASLVDGAGNLLFLRAVHTYERAEMTTVFASFRDVSQLLPPAVCAVILSLFALPAVFVAGGLVMLASSALCSRIPRRL